MNKDHIEGWIKLTGAILAAVGTFAAIQSSPRSTALFCAVLVILLLIYYIIDLAYFTLASGPDWGICVIKWCLNVPLIGLSAYLFIVHADDQFPIAQKQLPKWAPTGELTYLVIVLSNILYLMWDAIRCWHKGHWDWIGVAIAAALIGFGLLIWLAVVYTKRIPASPIEAPVKAVGICPSSFGALTERDFLNFWERNL